MKLALGTVQFGLEYGINNPAILPSKQEIKKIFSLAVKSGISILDTAPVYGNAESIIMEYGSSNFDIVSKFYQVKNKQGLQESLQKSLQNLNRKSIYGFISHNADELIKNPSLWEVLVDMNQKKLVQKIGYSLYNIEQLDALLKLNMIPDLIQFPFSLLDRKFESILPELKARGIEIHVRSVFLQGLYFIKSNKLPPSLQPLANSLKQLEKICTIHKITMGELALNFAISEVSIDKVVIGVYNSKQLQQNINYLYSCKYSQTISDEVKKIKVKYPELLNPVTWSK